VKKSKPVYQSLCDGNKIKVHGPSRSAGICHYESRKPWNAAPANAFPLRPKNKVAIQRGKDLLAGYDKGNSFRPWYNRCGSGLLNRKRAQKFTITYTRVLARSGYVQVPTCHIHRDESVFDIQHDLTKYVDKTTKWGGSGRLLEEAPETRIRSLIESPCS
jgi:hypothetical protein